MVRRGALPISASTARGRARPRASDGRGPRQGAPAHAGDRRTCCSTATTTCSRRTPSTCGPRRRSSRSSSPMKVNGKVIIARGAEDNKGQLEDLLSQAVARLEDCGRSAADLQSRCCWKARRSAARRRCRASSPSTARRSRSRPRARLRHRPVGQGHARPSPPKLRGLAGLSRCTVTGPSRDLHSGIYGGPATNPDPRAGGHHGQDARRPRQGCACRASTTASQETPAAKQIKQWKSLGLRSRRPFLGTVGLTQPAGEADRTACWSRSGRGRRWSSTASQAATRASAPRRSFRRRRR